MRIGRFHLSLVALGMLLIVSAGSVSASPDPSRRLSRREPASFRHDQKSPFSHDAKVTACVMQCHGYSHKIYHKYELCPDKNGQTDIKCLCRTPAPYWKHFASCVKTGIPASVQHGTYLGCPTYAEEIFEKQCSRCNIGHERVPCPISYKWKG